MPFISLEGDRAHEGVSVLPRYFQSVLHVPVIGYRKYPYISDDLKALQATAHPDVVRYLYLAQYMELSACVQYDGSATWYYALHWTDDFLLRYGDTQENRRLIQPFAIPELTIIIGNSQPYYDLIAIDPARWICIDTIHPMFQGRPCDDLESKLWYVIERRYRDSIRGSLHDEWDFHDQLREDYGEFRPPFVYEPPFENS
jgi:hypothetical protein